MIMKKVKIKILIITKRKMITIKIIKSINI